MKSIPVEAEIVDAQTGEVRERIVTPFRLLPPKKGLCSACAVDHTPDLPHNAQSLYYQYSFYADHLRWPTWADAMAHCTEEMKAFWKEKLGVRYAAPEGEPIATPYSVQQ